MPTSHPELRETIKKWYSELDANPDFVVVDIGAGCGTYSDLLRSEKKNGWVAIEAWAPYVTQFKLLEKYDVVIVSDFRFFNKSAIVNTPGLAIIGDCLEHFAMSDALAILYDLIHWADNVFVSVPYGDCPQNSVDGNWFEQHLSTWNHEELKQIIISMGGKIKEEAQGKVLSAFWISKA